MPIAWLVLCALSLIAPATLKFDAPPGWTSKTPASTSRVAEFVLPKADGDAEDASLVVFFFGGQGGGVQANIDRWITQLEQPDGRPSKDRAQTSTLTAHALTITLFDLSGTYVAEMSPGSADHFSKPGFRLRAAVVETPGGNYFVKLTGPQRTVARWDESFMTFIRSFRFE